jgi:TolB-like protein
MYLSALAGVVAVIGMWNLFEGRRPGGPEWHHVVAVSPFEMDELHADLLRELSRFPDLDVIDLAGGRPAPDHADFLLEGSLERREPGWWLTARLRDLDEDRVLWSDAFAMQETGVHDASARLAQRLSHALKIHPAEAP